MPRTSRTTMLLLAALALSACSNAGEGGAPATTQAQRFSVELASYDLAAGKPGRFLVGLPTLEGRLIAYGEVRMGFAFLGERQPASSGTTSITATGRYLAVPGSAEGAGREGPVEVPGSEGRGVYAAEVAFDRPGYWGVQVSADLKGSGPASAGTVFQVQPRHLVPAVGQPAPRTRNHVLGAKGVPPAAIDSRAAVDQGQIPDAELHRLTIAQAIALRRPTVAVFATPVYCVSQFCGPVTDMVAGLAGRYRGRASFVHVEIWRDFDKREINQAAAEWLYRNGNLNEPWVFVIGSDGRIAARFDNVASQREVQAALDKALAVS